MSKNRGLISKERKHSVFSELALKNAAILIQTMARIGVCKMYQEPRLTRLILSPFLS